MYERLPLDFIGVTEKFGSRKDPITGVSTYHYGVDLGWHKYQGEPVYAIMDSKVLYTSFDTNLGNYIVLTYDKGNSTIIYRFLHLKEKPNFKVGDKVLRGKEVGKMGTTGYSTGVHLHFEYWVCPKGYKYNYEDRSKYAKNPLDYCYLFEDQEVSEKSKNAIIKVVGTNLLTKRDTKKNQIEVIKDSLRCRTGAGTNFNILGYIDFGIYDYSDVKESDGYTWYKIGNDMWVANASNSLKIYEKEEPEKEIPLDKTLENYNVFICPKEGYYYIYLKNDEKIYFPK